MTYQEILRITGTMAEKISSNELVDLAEKILKRLREEYSDFDFSERINTNEITMQYEKYSRT